MPLDLQAIQPGRDIRDRFGRRSQPPARPCIWPALNLEQAGSLQPSPTFPPSAIGEAGQVGQVGRRWQGAGLDEEPPQAVRMRPSEGGQNQVDPACGWRQGGPVAKLYQITGKAKPVSRLQFAGVS